MSSIGSISGQINFSGLGSETDTTSVVDKLIEVEEYGIARMELWRSEWSAKITSIQGLSTRVSALYEAAQAMNQDFEFYSRTSSSSDSSVVTVTNTPYAQPGAHSVEVASAVQHRLATVGFADTASLVGGSAGEEFSILVGTTSLTLSYGSNYAAGQWDVNATLQDFGDALSAVDAAGSDVLEDVEFMDDGSDNGAIRMVLMAKEGGVDNKITIENDPTDLGLDGGPNIDYAVEPQTGWSGTSVITPTSTEGYTGNVNKRFTFTITTGETVSAASDSTAAVISWSDGQGHTGTLDVTSAGTYAVYQGVEITFASGTLVEGQSFSLDVYNPTIQKAQDNGLAQVEQVTHGGFADTGTTAVTTTDGTISMRYGGNLFTVDVDAGSTLNELVAAINSDADNPGITASVFDDGLGLPTSKHLRLTGDDLGAEHAITDITLTDIDNFSDDFTTTQQAQNSMIKVDGYPLDSGVYIQRSSNQISDIITGVELKLQSAGNANVTVENDISTIASKIEEFVSSVNYVLEYIREETKYDEETEEYGIMIGNYVFNMVYNSIRSIMTSSISGLDDAGNVYTMLAQIGISTDPDNNGLFEIDESTLDTALTYNLEDVAALFIQDADNGLDGVAELMRIQTYNLAESASNPLDVLIENYQGIIDGIDEKIEKEERRVALVESRLRDKYSRLESTLAVLNEEQTQLESLIAELS